MVTLKPTVRLNDLNEASLQLKPYILIYWVTIFYMIKTSYNKLFGLEFLYDTIYYITLYCMSKQPRKKNILSPGPVEAVYSDLLGNYFLYD